MKNLTIIFLTGFFFFLTSCSTDKSSIENDLKTENLKGEVILVYQSNEVSEKDETINISTYNENGMLTKYFYSSYGRYFDLHEIIYENDKKTLVKKNGNLGNGGYQFEEKYSYNNDGKLTSIDGKDFNSLFNYNEDGKLIKNIMSTDDNRMSSIKQYYYNEDELDSTVFTIEFKDNSEGNSVTIEKFKDNTIKSTDYLFKNEGVRILLSTKEKTNNENGDCIKEVNSEYDKMGLVTKSVTTNYEYDYDQKGNWIQKRTIEDGVLKTTENRTIIYKGGETSLYLNKVEKFVASVENGTNSQKTPSNSHSSDNHSNVNGYCYPCSGLGYFNGCQALGCSDGKKRCNDCGGNGITNDGRNCWHCGGQGYVLCKKCGGNPNYTTKCTACDGKGYY